MTTMPDRYREVSVTDVDVPLTAAALRRLLMSRPVYRRTRYVLVRHAGEAALVEVDKRASDELFWDVLEVRLLAGPEETGWVVDATLDPGIPSDLARAAASRPDVRCVILEGRYGHISFVLDSTPVRLHVLDVAPPHPAKLLDQVIRLLATAEDLPGVLPLPQVDELGDLVPAGATGDFLLPCRGGGMDVPGATVHYLDEVPPRQDWTLLGCARSRAIHEFLYDGDLRQVDTCPRALAASVELAPGDVLLTKCCLLEEHVESEGQLVVVPWGASFANLREALEKAVQLAAP